MRLSSPGFTKFLETVHLWFTKFKKYSSSTSSNIFGGPLSSSSLSGILATKMIGLPIKVPQVSEVLFFCCVGFFFQSIISLLFRLGNFHCLSLSSLILSCALCILLLSHPLVYYIVFFISEISICFLFISHILFLRLSVFHLFQVLVIIHYNIFMMAAIKSLSNNSNICQAKMDTTLFLPGRYGRWVAVGAPHSASIDPG